MERQVMISSGESSSLTAETASQLGRHVLHSLLVSRRDTERKRYGISSLFCPHHGSVSDPSCRAQAANPHRQAGNRLGLIAVEPVDERACGIGVSELVD